MLTNDEYQQSAIDSINEIESISNGISDDIMTIFASKHCNEHYITIDAYDMNEFFLASITIHMHFDSTDAINFLISIVNSEINRHKSLKYTIKRKSK